MAENNQTSMTREERWAEIQKWVAWVDAQRLLGGELTQKIIHVWANEPKGSAVSVSEWIQQEVIPEPDPVILYILWQEDSTYRNMVRKEFEKLYNKGATQ